MGAQHAIWRHRARACDFQRADRVDGWKHTSIEEVGLGSRFSVELPLPSQSSSLKVITSQNETNKQTRVKVLTKPIENNQDKPVSSKAQVLVVEDNSVNQVVITRFRAAQPKL